MKIAHGVNLFNTTRKDLAEAQIMTAASLRHAALSCINKPDLYIIPEDDFPIPSGFRATARLRRSIHDFGFIRIPKMRLLSEIVGNLYAAATDADLLILTNADICVMPHFYDWVHHVFTKNDVEAVEVRRRVIPTEYTKVSELPLAYAEWGRNHGGADTFIWKRHLTDRFFFANGMIGLYGQGTIMRLNLWAATDKAVDVTNKHLTFHLGLSPKPGPEKEDAKNFNYNEIWQVFDFLSKGNPRLAAERERIQMGWAIPVRDTL